MNMYNYQSSPVQSSPVQSSPVQSVIIPTYNRKEMLKEAIESVLAQSLKDLEVLVVDDCSTDGTEDFVKSIHDERVHYIRNEKNSGQEVSRMNGLRQARGKYITFLDDDDYYTDYEFFAKAVKIHEEHEGLAMVCANAEKFNIHTGEKSISDIGKPGKIKGLDYVLKNKLYRKPTSTFPAVFSFKALKSSGLSDIPIYDSDTYFYTALYGDAYFLHEVIGVYRIHSESATLGYKKHKLYAERLFSKVITFLMHRKDIYEKLCSMIDKNTAQRWYIRSVNEAVTYYVLRRAGFKNNIKFLRKALIISGFMPKLWLMLPLLRLKSNIGHLLRKIIK